MSPSARPGCAPSSVSSPASPTTSPASQRSRPRSARARPSARRSTERSSPCSSSSRRSAVARSGRGPSRAASPATCRRISASSGRDRAASSRRRSTASRVLLLDHPTAAQRLVGVAPLGADACLALGVTGPCLRASGIVFDQRCDSSVSRVWRARLRRPDRRAGRRLRSPRGRRRGDPTEPAHGRAVPSKTRGARADSRRSRVDGAREPRRPGRRGHVLDRVLDRASSRSSW